MDAEASKDFGEYIRMLVDILMDELSNDDQRLYAVTEILRQLDSPCKFFINIKKEKWAAVPSAKKTGIIKDVCMRLSKYLQYRHVLHRILRIFYSCLMCWER